MNVVVDGVENGYQSTRYDADGFSGAQYLKPQLWYSRTMDEAYWLEVFEQTEKCMEKLRSDVRLLGRMSASGLPDGGSYSICMEKELAELQRNMVRMKVLLYGILQHKSKVSVR